MTTMARFLGPASLYVTALCLVVLAVARVSAVEPPQQCLVSIQGHTYDFSALVRQMGYACGSAAIAGSGGASTRPWRPDRDAINWGLSVTEGSDHAGAGGDGGDCAQGAELVHHVR